MVTGISEGTISRKRRMASTGTINHIGRGTLPARRLNSPSFLSNPLYSSVGAFPMARFP